MNYLFATVCLVAISAASFADVAGPQSKGSRKSPAQVAEPADMTHTPPVPVRRWYQNFSRFRGDGSCVQCSLGINGVRRNNLASSSLLWDTIYGPAVLGGSDPSRVADYCRQRNIPIFNVTGDGTLKWAEYAADTGRGAAIWYGTLHFQTLMGRDKATGTWFVCNNNNPEDVTPYRDRDFRRIHVNSGRWIVVIDGPATPPAPRVLAKS